MEEASLETICQGPSFSISDALLFIHHLKLLTIEIVFILAISIILSNRYLQSDRKDKERRRAAIRYNCLDAETEDLPLKY